MRKNQVSIYVQRFSSEAPEGAVRQDIHVYADAYNIWEAVAAANYELSRRILQDQSLPQFGRASSESISKVYRKAEDSYIHVADYTDEMRKKVEENIFERNTNAVDARRRELEEQIEKYGDIRNPKSLYDETWAVCSPEGKEEYGDAEYVASKWTNAVVYYRYRGYDGTGKIRDCVRAYCFNDVVKSMLRYPKETEVDEYEEDYSVREFRLLKEIKRKLAGEAEQKNWMFIAAFYDAYAYLDMDDKSILHFLNKDDTIDLAYDIVREEFVEEGKEREGNPYSKNTIVSWCKYHKSQIQDMIATQSYTELQKYRSRWYEDEESWM